MTIQTQVQKQTQKIGTLYLVSTFSIKMLEFGRRTRVEITRLTPQEARSVFNRYMRKGLVVNTIAHKGSAKYMSKVLGVEMQPLKVSIKVKPGDALLVILPLDMSIPYGYDVPYEELLKLEKEGKVGIFLVTIEQAE